MQIVFRSEAGEQELDVELRNPEGTVADLVRGVLGSPAPPQVLVAGRTVPSSTLLVESGLHEAAVVDVAPALPSPAELATTDLELVVVAGPACGGVLPVPLGRSSAGRGLENALVVGFRTVSRQHARLEATLDAVRVTEARAANDTVVDGTPLPPDGSAELLPGQLLQLGRVALRLRRRRTDDRPHGLDPGRHAGPTGTVPFNRPPRPPRPAEPAVLPVPVAPSPPSATPFGIASFVGGFAMAALLVAITGQLRYAAFSAVMPFLAVGTWYEAKRRAKNGAGRSNRKYAAELEQLRQDALREGLVERARLEEVAPDVGEVLRRASLPSTRLWERRQDSEDALRLSAGVADLPWRPPLDSTWAGLEPRVVELLDTVRIPAAPVVVDLSHGGVVGVVGDRAAALAVARSLLLQAAVHHGPADLTVGVFVDPGREAEWEWAKWLPHTRVPGSPTQRWLAAARDASDALLRRLLGGAGRGTCLVVLDSAVLTEGRDAPARDLLQAGRRAAAARASSSGFATLGQPKAEEFPRTAGIVIAPTRDRLPAACTTVVQLLDEDGTAVVTRVEEGTSVQGVLSAGVDVATARACARDLAQYEDPELHVVGGGLPPGVRLLPLLELERVDGKSLLARWQRSGRDPGAVAPLGVTEQGRFVLDLVRDGAHGLVGGTTGSGKSELLRSLVAALAAHTDPHHLTFVLVDYKGGAAFDVCARLPHTVGMVTDLDEQLGERALLALEAELHHRERQLRTVGADNLPEYLALTAGDPDAEPMPRLVVVIDEFATMAAELPDFVSSLVGIAQRGRTLGVHLLLATQRPSGAVNDNIKANTNLRIALRVQDAGDSTDVIGVGDAAQIGRTQPGRAFVRLGPGEVVPIQTALVTCVTDEASDLAVDAAPFLFGPASRAPEPEGVREDDVRRRTDLARLVDAVVEANELAGLAPPRRPWPEPLTGDVDLAQLVDAPQPGSAPVAHVALADDPRRQTQYPVGWDLGEGNLLLYGVPGSGTTTTLAALALSLAATLSPEQLELQVLDAGAGDLAPLEGLPHTGSVVLAGDRERQARLLRHLRAELDRRRGLPREQALARRTVVLVDGYPALKAEFDDLDGSALLDGLARVFADGPELGLSFAMTADRSAGFSTALAAVATQKWLFRLADAYDYSTAGLGRKDVPHPVPGRCVLSPSALQAQVGRPTPDLAGAVAQVSRRWPGAARTATAVGVLPAAVPLDALPAADVHGEPWRVPVGVRESDLGPAVLSLYEGEHALVAGPARSGRSTTLAALAATLFSAGVHVVGTGGRRSPLRDCPALAAWCEPGQLAGAVAALRTHVGPAVLLVDDAEGFDDGDGTLAGLLTGAPPTLHVVASGRSDTLRSLYGHWTSQLRKSKTGLLLRPDVDMDGDLLGTTLPRRAPVRLGTGRGYLVHDGSLDLLQVAADLPPAP